MRRQKNKILKLVSYFLAAQHPVLRLRANRPQGMGPKGPGALGPGSGPGALGALGARALGTYGAPWAPLGSPWATRDPKMNQKLGT